MAPSEGRVARPKRWWSCRHGIHVWAHMLTGFTSTNINKKCKYKKKYVCTNIWQKLNSQLKDSHIKRINNSWPVPSGISITIIPNLCVFIYVIQWLAKHNFFQVHNTANIISSVVSRCLINMLTYIMQKVLPDNCHMIYYRDGWLDG